MGLTVFLHLLDVHVRVSLMEEVHTGQFDFAMIAVDCRGDHPFADVLCLRIFLFHFLFKSIPNPCF